jgi:hypothetical protein
MSRHIALLLTVLTAGATLTLAAAQPTAPAPVEQCQVADERLAELSGLAADGVSWYAVADGGRRLQVVVLRRDCRVQRMITAAVDPFDVEDLARGKDGRLWLADIGDNGRDRDTIALHVLSPQGMPELYRLTYPDGQHDAEALLLDRDDRPYVITKEVFGGAGVYRPAGPLSATGPTPLERVATVRMRSSDTPGGPSSSFAATVVTGAAASDEGSVIAVRTYTDAYLYAVPDGDVVAALGSEPLRVPLPDEPQGEAIAFEPDGTLLSASERAGAGPQPIRSVSGAAVLAAPEQESATPESTEAEAEPEEDSAGDGAAAQSDEPGRGPLSDWQAAVIALVAAAAVIVVISRVGRRAS